MTSYVPQSDVAASGVAFLLMDGDALSAGQAIDIDGTVGAAQVTGTDAWISCHGRMTGGLWGVGLGGIGGQLYVGAAGIVSGGKVGVDVTGAGAQVDNHGTVHGDRAGIFIIGEGPGAQQRTAMIRNSGTVSSPERAIHVNGEMGVVIIENTGVIEALTSGGLSYHSQWIATDIVMNSGTMIGGVVLGRGDDTFLSATGSVAGTIDGGAGNDTIAATGRDDVILGGAGDDTLEALAGDDAITGDAGKDSLSGGIGADRFVYRAAGDSTVSVSGRDTVADFDAVEHDRIDLAAIDADATVGRNQAFNFIGARGFSHHAGELRAVRVGADTIVYGDTDGDGVADLAIQLKAVTSLGAADFVL